MLVVIGERKAASDAHAARTTFSRLLNTVYGAESGSGGRVERGSVAIVGETRISSFKGCGSSLTEGEWGAIE